MTAPVYLASPSLLELLSDRAHCVPRTGQVTAAVEGDGPVMDGVESWDHERGTACKALKTYSRGHWVGK